MIFNVEKEKLETSNFRHEGRRVQVPLASTMCRGRYTFTELGHPLGISLDRMPENTYKFKKKINKNDKLKLAIENIKNSL